MRGGPCSDVTPAGDLVRQVSTSGGEDAAQSAKLAYRGTTEGVIAEMKMRQHTLGGLRLPENALVVVLESVEKPGNLGAVKRSGTESRRRLLPDGSEPDCRNIQRATISLSTSSRPLVVRSAC